MKQSHLRWLLPLAVYLVMIVLVLFLYRSKAYGDMAYEKELEIALAVQDDIRQRDMEIARSQVALETIGNLVLNMRLDDNRNQITVVMKKLVEGGYADRCEIYDLEGNGYDESDRDITLSGKLYEEALKDSYSGGGVGMIATDESLEKREVYVACGIKFVNKKKGYLVSTIPIRGFSDQRFGDDFLAEFAAIVDLNGRVMTDAGGKNPYETTQSVSMFDRLPSGLSKDTIKLAFSQKTTYMSRIQDYGYVIIVPQITVNGGALIFITEKQMRTMTSRALGRNTNMIILLISATIVYVILVFIAHFLGNSIQKKYFEKKNQELARDAVTGLLTGSAFAGEITRFISETQDPHGMMFIIKLTSMAADQDGTGATKLDEKRREFARVLTSGFRSTDIIGYLGGSDYAVFLKGIKEDKDIRKQTDELLMFLHDIREAGEGYEVYGNAGVALYPEKGLTAEELTNSAKDALLRACSLGKTKLSF